MSSKYDIDYTQQTNSQLPPDKRLPKWKSWLAAIVNAVQWLHDNIFTNYNLGSTYPFYNSGTTYNQGDRVIDVDNAVYESQVTQTGITPSQNYLPTTAQPIPPWQMVAISFIGVQERIKYSGQKLSLEFAINRWFRTTFRQPPLVSDIYIGINLWNEFFMIGGGDGSSSYLYGGNNPGDGFIQNDNTTSQNAFTIYVPDSGGSPRPGFYTSLQPNAEQKIRAIADKYVIAGALYTVTTY